RVLSRADVVVLLSERELEAYREFAPSAQSRLIANAVDTPDVDLGTGRYASDRPLEIVYLGRLAEDKGVLDVVTALRALRDRGIDASLRIAGCGPAEPRLREMITTHRLEAHVRLLGAIVGPAKQQLWQSAHVFAFPTLREGLPYALLESMAAGAVPVVAPVGAIPEVMQDGIHGLFVPFRNPPALTDALERLHRDRSALHRMAVAGRRRIVEHYSIARLAADFQRVYTGLVPSSAGAPLHRPLRDPD
ncbi:MAG: glycosyltransferase family 4 protein, partial [Steroidobacteraceae bacterium]